MNKKLITAGVIVGGTVGSYLPVLFGAGQLSGWSILGSLIGGLAGIWAGVKLSSYY